VKPICLARRVTSCPSAVVIALVISPIIFQAISSANSTNKITGTLATIVNLVPLFYYLAVAVLAVADIYIHLK